MSEVFVKNDTETGKNLILSGDLFIICKCKATTNILLDGSVTAQDDITLEVGDFIFCDSQTDLTENGVYEKRTSDWLRWVGLKGGTFVSVQAGTVYAGKFYRCSNETDIIPGTTEITFEQFGAINSDEKVKSDITDNTSKFLYDAMTQGTGITLEVYDSGGGNRKVRINSSLIGLPSGLSNQTLRHNGTNWVANSILTVATTSAGVEGSRAAGSVWNVTNNDKAGSGTDQFLINTPNTFDAGRIGNRNYIGNGHGFVQYLGYAMTGAISVNAAAYHLNYYSYISGALANVFKLLWDGSIFSKFYEGTGSRYLGADPSGNIIVMADPTGTPQVNTDWDATSGVAQLLNKPTDISEFTDTTGLIPDDLSDLTDTTGIIPENLASFMTNATQSFSNIQDVSSPIVPSTSFVKIDDNDENGTTVFTMSFLQGKRYKFDAKVMIANISEALLYEIRVDGNASWNSTLFIKKGQNSVFTDGYEPPVDTTTDYRHLELNVAQQFKVSDVASAFTAIEISGTIDTLISADVVTISMRNTSTVQATGTYGFTISGAWMSAMVSEIV